MPPAPEVSVATVVSKQVRQWDEFTGRVAAVETVELRPRVSGYVERVAFQEGQEVRKGDLLFAIDQRPYRAALESALAGLERARSEARLAQTQDVRAQALVEAKAISREEFDARRSATAQGNAAVRAAEAAVAAARLDLQFTEVRAPIDGRAGRAAVTEGFKHPVKVYSEFLDEEWVTASIYGEAEADFLRKKYGPRNIRVIVASAITALRFTSAFRDRMFPGVPVVHIAVARDALARMTLPPDMIGKTTILEAKTTMELALGLHPEAKRLAVVVGTSDRDLAWEKRIRAP
jgi:hypothetical protein